MYWSPPTVFVEEVIPEEAIQLPLKDMLFTVPENWHPPTSLPGEEIWAGTMAHHSVSTMASPMEDLPICYIEEEILDECLEMAHNDILSEGVSRLTVSEHEPKSTRTRA